MATAAPYTAFPNQLSPRPARRQAARSAAGCRSAARSPPRCSAWPASTGCCSTASMRRTTCSSLVPQLMALKDSASAPVVRPPWNDAVVIKRLLDAGFYNFLIPFVESADEARRAVAATRYPPAGVRGVSVSQRSNRYGTVRTTSRSINDNIAVMVQIESRDGVAAAVEHRGGGRHRRPVHRPVGPGRGASVISAMPAIRKCRTRWRTVFDRGQGRRQAGGHSRPGRSRRAPLHRQWARRSSPSAATSACSGWRRRRCATSFAGADAAPHRGAILNGPIALGGVNNENRIHRARHHGHADGGQPDQGRSRSSSSTAFRASRRPLVDAGGKACALRQGSRAEGRHHHHDGARHAGRGRRAVRRRTAWREGLSQGQDRRRHELDLADRDQGVRAEDQRARLRLPRRAGLRRRGRRQGGVADDHGRRHARRRSTRSSRCSS